MFFLSLFNFTICPFVDEEIEYNNGLKRSRKISGNEVDGNLPVWVSEVQRASRLSPVKRPDDRREESAAWQAKI
jgi:hypothetical protein